MCPHFALHLRSRGSRHRIRVHPEPVAKGHRILARRRQQERLRRDGAHVHDRMRQALRGHGQVPRRPGEKATTDGISSSHPRQSPGMIEQRNSFLEQTSLQGWEIISLKVVCSQPRGHAP